jgi:hypothetical protein
VSPFERYTSVNSTLARPDRYAKALREDPRAIGQK